MPTQKRCAALALLVAASSLPALAAEGPKAVETPGAGILTMCRSWIVFSSCHDYQNVALPDRIAVGDTVPLRFGSNPKEYAFPVARILRQGAGCTMLSTASGDADNAEKIQVPSCKPVAEAK